VLADGVAVGQILAAAGGYVRELVEHIVAARFADTVKRHAEQLIGWIVADAAPIVLSFASASVATAYLTGCLEDGPRQLIRLNQFALHPNAVIVIPACRRPKLLLFEWR
jgi:hypothetical protein